MPAGVAELARRCAVWPGRNPWAFASAAAALYVLALLPLGRPHHFDPSTLIVAGDKFVDPSATPSPIVVRHHSAGYDGQFYYGMALDPFMPRAHVTGVTFDHSAWRWQRILYPLLSYVLAFGNTALVPGTLFVVNLASLMVIARLASRCMNPTASNRAAATEAGDYFFSQEKQQNTSMTLSLNSPAATRRVSGSFWLSVPNKNTLPSLVPKRKGLLSPALWPYAFMLWPGFMISLTHDTTELLACALLLGAIMAYLDGRYVSFALLGAAAALTRETCSLALFGIALARLVLALDAATKIGGRRSIRTNAVPLVAAGMAIVPCLLWHLWLARHFAAAAEAAPLHANLGWPLAGCAQRLALSLHDTFVGQGLSLKLRLTSAYAAATTLFIIAFSVAVALSLPRLRRNQPQAIPVAAGWLCMMVLMSMLSANGPWIDPTAIFRAFSESFVVGSLLVARSGASLPWQGAVAMLPLAWMNWLACSAQLR